MARTSYQLLDRTGGLSRRDVLRATLLGTAAAAASSFPAPFVHADDPITLRYAGTGVNAFKELADKCKEDTGIIIQYTTLTSDDVVKRAVTQPSSFDMLDSEYWMLKKIVPSGNLRGMDTKKIKLYDEIVPIFTKGALPDGSKTSRVGVAPIKVSYLTGGEATEFAADPTEYMTLIPTVYNADTLGIRPDLIDVPIDSWAQLVDPKFKGKASILNIPAIGIMDAGQVAQASGVVKYGDMGNMTKEEIDKTIAFMIEAKQAGQFRALWKEFNESVNLMASGEVVIQSMWSPAVTKVRQMGIACKYQPLKEGYRAWAAGLGIPTHVEGKTLDACYEFVNWFLSGWAGALPQPPGLLRGRALDRAAEHGGLRVGLLDGGQAGREGHRLAHRRGDRQARRDPRRRLVLRAHGCGGGVEHRHGRGQVHGPQVERVRGGLS